MTEHKVGDVVEDDGVKYRAVKGDGACSDCCHDFKGECKKDILIFGCCSRLLRETCCDWIKWEIVK